MKKILKWGGIGFVVLIIIGAIAGSGKSSTTQTTSSNTLTQNQEQKPTQEPIKENVQEPMKVTAQEIADDFDSNQVAAEKTWNGKLVEFSAKITNITDTGLSFSNVASKQFSMAQISCRVDDKQQLLSLKNGETATVRGIVGKQTIGVIDVSKCVVVK